MMGVVKMGSDAPPGQTRLIRCIYRGLSSYSTIGAYDCSGRNVISLSVTWLFAVGMFDGKKSKLEFPFRLLHQGRETDIYPTCLFW